MISHGKTRASWLCQVGDLGFRVDVPHQWVVDQRAYLAEYLPGKLGDSDFEPFQLTVVNEPTAARPPADAEFDNTIEYVPGAFLRSGSDPSGRRWFVVADDALERQPGAFAVRVHGRQINLHVHNRAAKPHAYPLRLMREAALRTYEDLGYLVIHGAGVDIAGHGVLVCGPRFAGKTTTLAALFRESGGDLLSNDRLLLDNRGRLLPVPLPVPVARGTIDAVTELATALSSAKRPQPPLRQLPATFGATRKAEFTAREFASAFSRKLARGSWLETLIVPKLSATDEPATITALSRPEVEDVLAANCFTPRDEFWLTPWVVPRTTPDDQLAARASTVIAKLAPRLRAFEVRWGVHGDFDDLTRAITEVLRRCR